MRTGLHRRLVVGCSWLIQLVIVVSGSCQSSESPLCARRRGDEVDEQGVDVGEGGSHLREVQGLVLEDVREEDRELQHGRRSGRHARNNDARYMDTENEVLSTLI